MCSNVKPDKCDAFQMIEFMRTQTQDFNLK